MWQKRLFISMLLYSFSVSAIVIRHDVEDKHYLAEASEFLPLATLYKDGGHGTLIDQRWVVTAAHGTFCLGQGKSIKIGDKNRLVKQLYVHKDYKTGRSHDIALIELEHSIDDIMPAKLYKKDDEARTIVWFIGAGGTGNGNTGQVIDNVENMGVLRKAQNIVKHSEGPLLSFSFDQGRKALPLEGVSGGGDSGGPAYIEQDNQYWLLGVSSRFEGAGIGLYGITEFYSRISYFSSWIESVIQNSDLVSNSFTHELTRLPAGLTPKNLPEVCQQINF